MTASTAMCAQARLLDSLSSFDDVDSEAPRPCQAASAWCATSTTTTTWRCGRPAARRRLSSARSPGRPTRRSSPLTGCGRATPRTRCSRSTRRVRQAGRRARPRAAGHLPRRPGPASSSRRRPLPQPVHAVSPRLAQGQPGVHVRVQPARPPGLPRHRGGRRHRRRAPSSRRSRRPSSTTTPVKKFRHDVDDGREVIWMSERDGWNHLYLYDGATGRGEEPDHEGRVGGPRRRSRGRGEAQIWFSAERHGPGRTPTSCTTTASTSTAPA
jgi:hypothetical protein